MFSTDDICNQALLKIGVAPTALDDPESDVARALNLMYEPNRLKLLRLHNWHFALKSAELAQLYSHHHDCSGTSPRLSFYGPGRYTAPLINPGERYFALPHDCIKIDVITHPYRIPYEIEQKFIKARTHFMRLRYVRNIKDPNQFDALFTDCLSTLLGGQIAYMVSGAESKGQALKAEFMQLLMDAKRIDSQENHNAQFLNTDDLYFCRYTSGYLEPY
jgi:hypothetical protein